MRLRQAATVALATLAAAALVPAASTRSTVHTAGPSMSLEGPPTLDKRFVQGGEGNGWGIPDDGGAVTWHPPFGDATYTWNMPDTIPATGAKVTLSVTAHAVEGQRFAPGMAIVGGVVKEGRVDVGALAESGKTVKVTKTATLMPLSVGRDVVQVGIQDGPTYTYTYVRGAEEILLTLSYAVVAPGAALSAGHVSIGTEIALETTAEPPPTSGVSIQLYAKIQGSTAGGKAGNLILSCSREHCSRHYTQRYNPFVIAFRAFAVRGRVGSPDYKVLARSNSVVVTWEEPKIPIELLVQTQGDEPYAATGKAPVGTRVRLRAEADAPLPPGTRLLIQWSLNPNGGWLGFPVECVRTVCTGIKKYNLPATLTFRSVIVRSMGPGNSRVVSQSKLIQVTWGKG